MKNSLPINDLRMDLPETRAAYLWMDSPYVAVSKPNEKLSAEKNITWGSPAPALYTALAGIFLRVSRSKLQYLGEVSPSFDVHCDSIFLHFHSNYRDNISEESIIKLNSGFLFINIT